MVADREAGRVKKINFPNKSLLFPFPLARVLHHCSKVLTAIWKHPRRLGVTWRWWNVTFIYNKGNSEWRDIKEHVLSWFLIRLHIRIVRELHPSDRSYYWLLSFYPVPSRTLISPGRSPVRGALFESLSCQQGNWNSGRWSVQGHPDGPEVEVIWTQDGLLQRLLTTSQHSSQNTIPTDPWVPWPQMPT